MFCRGAVVGHNNLDFPGKITGRVGDGWKTIGAALDAIGEDDDVDIEHGHDSLLRVLLTLFGDTLPEFSPSASALASSILWTY